jgi:hypothetical protein
LQAGHHRQPPVDATAVGLVTERIPVPGSAEGSRSATRSVPPPLDAAFAEHQRAAAAVSGPDPAEAPVAYSGLVDGAPSAPWWRRRWWVIAGGAIAVLVLNTALVVGMAQLLADGSSPIPTDTSTAKIPPVPNGFPQGLYLPAPDHVLALKSVGAAADRPNDQYGTLDALGISRDELTRYEDFQGPVVRDLHGMLGWPLNVWSGESRSGITCLFVAVPEQGIRGGNSAEGCSPEGLDTITELRHMTGDGFTRFLLEDDHIDVYVYVRAPDPSESQG